MNSVPSEFCDDGLADDQPPADEPDERAAQVHRARDDRLKRRPQADDLFLVSRVLLATTVEAIELLPFVRERFDHLHARQRVADDGGESRPVGPQSAEHRLHLHAAVVRQHRQRRHG
jgi:hypothetical protein